MFRSAGGVSCIAGPDEPAREDARLTDFAAAHGSQARGPSDSGFLYQWDAPGRSAAAAAVEETAAAK